MFKILPALTLLLFYLLAASGFGIHECRTRGTVDVLPVIYGTGCDNIHKDHDGGSECTGGCCSSSNRTEAESSDRSHTDDCCSTEVHKLGNDYESIDQLTVSPERSLQLIHVFIAGTGELFYQSGLFSVNNSESPEESPPPLKYNRYSFISQWRL